MEVWGIERDPEVKCVCVCVCYGLQEGYRLVGVGISHIKHHTFIIQVYTPSGHAPC